jgi:hypothetical protein
MFGLILNRPHQPANSIFVEDSYTLSIVEFDDQGLCYRRGQMDALSAELARLEGSAPVIVVFAHGWKHDARSSDGNLSSFKAILKNTSLMAEGRPVFGVFIAWRGLTWYGCGIDNLTFWGRQEAAMRVAVGSPRELLGRLRQFRDREIKEGRAEPVLVIIGHSFGGLLIYSAVAQSLIESAATQAGQIVPSFANLVLVVNAAFAAARYLPIQDQIQNRTFAEGQPPVFAAVTARNDWATGAAFPVGEFIPTLSESTLTWRERQAILSTIGHMRPIMTHTVTAPGKPRAKLQAQGPSRPAPAPTTNDVGASTHAAGVRRFPGGAVLTPTATYQANNPYWIVSADREVVDEHDFIFGQVFCDFICALVISHLVHAHERDQRRHERRPPS